jgi:hypothetical protein
LIFCIIAWRLRAEASYSRLHWLGDIPGYAATSRGNNSNISADLMQRSWYLDRGRPVFFFGTNWGQTTDDRLVSQVASDLFMDKVSTDMDMWRSTLHPMYINSVGPMLSLLVYLCSLLFGSDLGKGG